MIQQPAVGETTYIRLEGFNPPWRQAVIVFAARVSEAELTESSISGLTLVERWGFKVHLG